MKLFRSLYQTYKDFNLLLVTDRGETSFRKKRKKRHDFADNKPMECMKCQSHGLILNLKIFFQFSKLIINKIKFVLQSKLIYNIYLGQIFDISRVFYLFIFIY